MPNDIITAIFEICPSLNLREALLCSDYDTAFSIIQELMDEMDCYEQPFGLFDSLYEGIKNNNEGKIVEVIIRSEKLFFLNASRNIISYYSLLDNDITNPLANANTDFYFRYIGFIRRYPSVKNIDYNHFAQEFLKCSNKKYPKVNALEIVFSLDYDGEDDLLVNYIESLIYGNEVSYEDVMECVLNEDYDTLMEKFLVIKYLRETYLDKVEKDIVELQKEIDFMKNFGLERKKPYSKE